MLLELVQDGALLLLHLVELGLQMLDLLRKVVNLSSATIRVVWRLWVACLPNAALIDVLKGLRRLLQTHLRVVDHRQLPSGRMLLQECRTHLRSLGWLVDLLLLLERQSWLLH